jgi:DNA-binding NarL/FixJ family response regulator
VWRRAPADLARILLVTHDPAGQLEAAPSGPARSTTSACAYPMTAPRCDPQEPLPQLAELTERERYILQLVAPGLSNAEIVGRLVISPLTAQSHVRKSLRKLDCHDLAARVAQASERGLIPHGEAET